ncbi:MAG: hypothetical protein H7641_05095 [Candidatus Heimdallarchaeota archaeon]|nr:hypothetical protein [Candidatus Heimdallarchaeota archaeon]
MNNVLFKMDKQLKGLNKELDKILKKYPRYLDNDSRKLNYELYKYDSGR